MKIKYFIICLLPAFASCDFKKQVVHESSNWDTVKSYYITTNLNGNSTLHIITTSNPKPFVQDFEPAKLLAIKAVLDQGPTRFDRDNGILEPMAKPTAMYSGFSTNRSTR